MDYLGTTTGSIDGYSEFRLWLICRVAGLGNPIIALTKLFWDGGGFAPKMCSMGFSGE